MKKYPTHQVMRKQSMQGATLVEVLVSVFLLTFGILGLMAAQLRSVAAVGESENRSIAAQAAENLAEAMQANPRITSSARDYSDYFQSNMTEAKLAATCENTPSSISDDSKKPCAVGKNGITKKELAEVHLGEFEYILQQMPNAVSVKYAVCLDDPASVKAATMSNANCVGTGVPVIKVAWETLVDQSASEEGVPGQEEQSYYLVVPQ